MPLAASRIDAGLGLRRTTWAPILFQAMPTYIYETVPAKKGARVKRYEIRQSIKDAALTQHPETREPIRRVLADSVSVLTSSSSSSSGPAHRHTHSCGCGAGGCGR